MPNRQHLYRTAEEFAPFNVIVQQIHGNGVYSTTAGATTIFINDTSTGILTGDLTPTASMDYPSTKTSLSPSSSTPTPTTLSSLTRIFKGYPRPPQCGRYV